MCYGLVRSAHTLEQAGYVQTDFIKFVWVYWRPDNIPVARKMQIGVSEGEMKTLFSPYHAELQACTDEELGAGPLAEILDGVTMRCENTTAQSVSVYTSGEKVSCVHIIRTSSFYHFAVCRPFVLLSLFKKISLLRYIFRF